MESNGSSSKQEQSLVGQQSAPHGQILSDDRVLDAKARGLKHPKFWGFWAMNGNNSSGLILYLIGRRNYPVQNMSIEDQEKIETRKKAAGAALVFLALGAIGFVINVMRIHI